MILFATPQVLVTRLGFVPVSLRDEGLHRHVLLRAADQRAVHGLVPVPDPAAQAHVRRVRLDGGELIDVDPRRREHDEKVRDDASGFFRR